MSLLRRYATKIAIAVAALSFAGSALADAQKACAKATEKKDVCPHAKPKWQAPAKQPTQIKVVEKVVKEPVYIPQASGAVESSSAVTIDQRKIYYKDPETEALRARLHAAEERARRAEARATQAEAKASKASAAASKNHYHARRYYERYRLLKAQESAKASAAASAAASASSSSCCGKGNCDKCGDSCCDDASGFYLGVIGGVAPYTLTEYCEEIDGYQVVSQQYRPVIGLRFSGVSSGGFAGGLSLLSNKSALLDLNVRLN